MLNNCLSDHIPHNSATELLGNPLFQIANLVTLQGSTKPLIRNVMTLNSCSPIVGADVFSHDTEAELLLRWAKLVRDVDPDVIIGYNIANFDLPYLIERARVKGLQVGFGSNSVSKQGMP